MDEIFLLWAFAEMGHPAKAIKRIVNHTYEFVFISLYVFLVGTSIKKFVIKFAAVFLLLIIVIVHPFYLH